VSGGSGAKETVRAAGALCWRRAPDGLEVLLVHSARYGEWTWPKGKPEAVEGAPELLPETAVREVAEETGVRIRLGRPLPEVRYRLPDGRPKRVSYWVGRAYAQGERTAPPDEIDDSAWVRVEEARDRLTRANDHRPLDRLLHFAARDRLGTRALLVVRHARAVPRKQWTGRDEDRPLTLVGLREARRLVPLLDCWRPELLVTSPWRRCADTMRPYARANGSAPLRPDQELTEDGAAHDPAAAASVVRRLVAADEDAALCTHRPVLGAVMNALRESATRSVGRQLPSSDPFLGKAEILVAHVTPGTTGSRIRDVERFDVG
jgi:phosphohistidine phosphatase SixA/8-oxo-dGTP pyrophosphatase MutT (NUDIX family)